jgi:hypothetical protein
MLMNDNRTGPTVVLPKKENKCCTGEAPRRKGTPNPETKCNNTRNEGSTKKPHPIHQNEGGNEEFPAPQDQG